MDTYYQRDGMTKFKQIHLPTHKASDLAKWFSGAVARRFIILGIASSLLAFIEIYRFSVLPALAVSLDQDGAGDPVRLAVLTAFVFCVAHPLALGVATWLRNEWIQIQTRNDLVSAIFQRTLRRSYRDFANAAPGMTSSYVTGYAQTLLGMTRIGYVDSIYFVTTLVTISVYFADFQANLFLPILFWLLALLGLGALFFRGASAEAQAAMAAQGGWFGAQTETFANWALVKGAHNETREFSAFRTRLIDAEPLELKVQRRMRRLLVSVAVVNGATLSLMIWFALTGLRDGTLGIEALLFILPVSLKIVSLSEAALGIGNQFFVILGQVKGSAAHLKLDQPDLPALAVTDTDQKHVAQLEGVEVRVAPDSVLFSDFNLSIGAGEVIALTGPSGAGKSTLMHTMAGLFDVAGGALRIVHRQGRPSVALCPQKTSIFNRSLRDNILYGVDAPDEDALLRAISIVGLDDLLRRLGRGDIAAGLEFEVAPDGANLSGGQLQRVSIARALVQNPALLLLDEATTGIEREMERQILSDIRGAYPEMAIVIVSHNKTTLDLADREVVLSGPSDT